VSLESVRAFLRAHAPDVAVIPLEHASETTWLATAWNIAPARIAKALTLRLGDRHVLLMACGDARLDNGKLKRALGGKARMVSADESAAITGHPPGGICPFGLATPIPIYCDMLLKRFDTVVTGGGATHSAVRIAPELMAEITGANWGDVCGEPG
jgi:prolyl-tRNA editing enzyme YbaK/EbsC (Cys-tRNA(Pro) deacylase)